MTLGDIIRDAQYQAIVRLHDAIDDSWGDRRHDIRHNLMLALLHMDDAKSEKELAA